MIYGNVWPPYLFSNYCFNKYISSRYLQSAGSTHFYPPHLACLLISFPLGPGFRMRTEQFITWRLNVTPNSNQLGWRRGATRKAKKTDRIAIVSSMLFTKKIRTRTQPSLDLVSYDGVKESIHYCISTRRTERKNLPIGDQRSAWLDTLSTRKVDTYIEGTLAPSR